MTETKKYDVVIIGGGPAGLTAGIYAGRRALKTLVATKDIGGQIAQTSEVENYPGFELISGFDLAKKFFNQAKKFGAEIKFDEAKKITKSKDGFKIKFTRETVEAKTIILAFGKKPRELGVPGEERLRGAGVSYCATCDAPFFKGKILTIVGGGNTALESSIFSAAIAKKVYLIYRGSEFRGEKILQEKVKKIPNVEIMFSEEVTEVFGKDTVDSISLKSGKKLKTDGIIVEIGFVVDRTLAEGFVEMDEKNQIVINPLQETSVPGIFAAGDLTQTAAKQVVIAAGEGAKAALSCFDYLQRIDGKRGILADWH
ncbi:thioredoxin reductase [Candidatus Berkelbacteria bacterium CG10_big_fil_rev_8_21_14_0_10_43_13]|uniref:Thioredoxin reductase n=1 Tax=Candidatus Berkelbacteria bacterium CG10_big_fil_rev_8_21_14_0_10_43_13 TaxID=1974514 RepID=A0A2H0W6C5_9BACT|nr:MAG: thioredoxin reductase [Candidatus Berkelbacteria bacterium CG10_big_fil_rev_8_21_14_0_10_43_13]